MLRHLILAGCVVLAAHPLWANQIETRYPDSLAPEPPQQEIVHDAQPITHNGYRLQPLARIALKALVLGREDYRDDREAELSPMDLALGWGPMSDRTVLSAVDIRQAERFYFWSVERFPVPREEIEHNSANMHIIPADAAVAAELAEIRSGELVSLRGYLVEAHSSDRWRWTSSLTREDTGNGACELVWVEAVERTGAAPDKAANY